MLPDALLSVNREPVTGVRDHQLRGPSGGPNQVPLGSGASRKVLALALRGFLLSSDTSIEAAPEPVKLFEGIGKGGCDLGSRLTVQPLCLD